MLRILALSLILSLSATGAALAGTDGSQWLYARAGAKVVRYRLDDLSVSEIVWTRSPVGAWFGVSADGTRAPISPPASDALMVGMPDDFDTPVFVEAERFDRLESDGPHMGSDIDLPR